MDIIQKIEILSNARQRISKPENFLQCQLDNNRGGYCSVGAVMAAIHGDTKHNLSGIGTECCVELSKDLPSTVGRSSIGMVILYNNSHSHAEVLAMFDTTIKRLKRELVIENLKEAKVTLETEGEWKVLESV